MVKKSFNWIALVAIVALIVAVVAVVLVLRGGSVQMSPFTWGNIWPNSVQSISFGHSEEGAEEPYMFADIPKKYLSSNYVIHFAVDSAEWDDQGTIHLLWTMSSAPWGNTFQCSTTYDLPGNPFCAFVIPINEDMGGTRMNMQINIFDKKGKLVASGMGIGNYHDWSGGEWWHFSEWGAENIFHLPNSKAPETLRDEQYI